MNLSSFLSTEIHEFIGPLVAMKMKSDFLVLLNHLVLARLIWQKYLTQQPNTQLVLKLIVNYEIHLLRQLIDTGSRSNNIYKACTSVSLKNYDNHTIIWSIMNKQSIGSEPHYQS
jgi:hypothetical protein